MRITTRVAALVGVSALVAGCDSGSPEPSAAIVAVIASARDDSAAALAAINRLAADSPAALRATAMSQVEDADPAVRGAARYALAISVTADDAAAVAALRELLEADGDADRLTAAGGLLAIGDKAAVPVLIDLLSSTARAPFAHPPMQVWQVAAALLLTHTDQELGLAGARDANLALASQQRWRAWWSSTSSTIAWNASAGRFTQ
jgi:HEAT repeat protein